MRSEPSVPRQSWHEQALDAASRLAVDRGWDRLRMGMVAAAVGISRPTLYKVFRDKGGLAQAVLMREVGRFLAGVTAALTQNEDTEGAIAAAVRSALDDGEQNPLLRMVLTPGPGGHTDLLRLLTSEGADVITAIQGTVGPWAEEHFPAADPARRAHTVEAVARLALSYLLLPPADREAAAVTTAGLAVSYLQR